MKLGAFPFVATPNYTNASRTKIDVVVMHTAETPETATSAEATANYFASTGRDVSAHYCVDANSVVQCVKLEDVAWAAPGANHNGIQIELAGRAGQTAAQWADAYSKHELDLAAELVSLLCRRYAIPVRALTPADLLAGRRGVTTHAAVSRAFRGSDHWDPGPAFPMSGFLGRVAHYGGPVAAVAPEPLPTLRVGSSGWAVTKAQKLLVRTGAKVAVDGAFGAATAKAVRGFQKAHGLNPDGVVGRSTWAELVLEARS